MTIPSVIVGRWAEGWCKKPAMSGATRSGSSYAHHVTSTFDDVKPRVRQAVAQMLTDARRRQRVGVPEKEERRFPDRRQPIAGSRSRRR